MTPKQLNQGLQNWLHLHAWHERVDDRGRRLSHWGLPRHPTSGYDVACDGSESSADVRSHVALSAALLGCRRYYMHPHACRLLAISTPALGSHLEARSPCSVSLGFPPGLHSFRPHITAFTLIQPADQPPAVSPSRLPQQTWIGEHSGKNLRYVTLLLAAQWNNILTLSCYSTSPARMQETSQSRIRSFSESNCSHPTPRPVPGVRKAGREE